MLDIYFSGTENSRHVLVVFLRIYDDTAQAYSIAL